MRGVTHHDHEKLTLLELVLQLHGEFRRSLEPIHERPSKQVCSSFCVVMRRPT